MRLQVRQNRLPERTVAGSVVIVILTTVLACGRDTSSPTSSPVQSPVDGSTQSLLPPVASIASFSPVEKESPFDGTQGKPATYRSRGRRDPFLPPRIKTPEKPRMEHLRLTGIIREGRSYYALVESDASPAVGYVIRENDVIDSAKVVKITTERVVFEVQTKNSEGKLFTRYVQKHLLPVESR